MQRWKTHVTSAVVELEKPFELPPASNDPVWCQGTQDACWGTAKQALTDIAKCALSIIAVVKHCIANQGAVEYGTVEKRLIRMLKQVKPLVTAIRTVAVLDDSPGLGKTLIRRTKTICRGINGVMQGLETSASDVQATLASVGAAVKELGGSAPEIAPFGRSVDMVASLPSSRRCLHRKGSFGAQTPHVIHPRFSQTMPARSF